MKVWLKVLFFSFLIISLKSQGIKEISIGSDLPLPEKVLQDVSGKSISMKEELNGKKGLLVIFSCNTCPYVKLYEGRISKILSFCREKNIGVVILNSNEAKRGDEDSFEAMKKYHAEHLKAGWYLLDEKSQVADALGASRTPQCFLFDEKGKLIYKGAIDDNVKNEAEIKIPYLQRALEALLSGRKPDIQETKSIGCTIKRLE